MLPSVQCTTVISAGCALRRVRVGQTRAVVNRGWAPRATAVASPTRRVSPSHPFTQHPGRPRPISASITLQGSCMTQKKKKKKKNPWMRTRFGVDRNNARDGLLLLLFILFYFSAHLRSGKGRTGQHGGLHRGGALLHESLHLHCLIMRVVRKKDDAASRADECLEYAGSRVSWPQLRFITGKY